MILDWLIDFVYPKSCVVCGREGSFLCGQCQSNLARAEQTCPECARASLGGWTHPRCKKKFGLDGLTTIYSYRDPNVRKVIEAIKFGFNRDLIKILLKNFILEDKFDLVIPVPLHRLRLNWRGFNQAEEIAKGIGQTPACRQAGPRLSNLLVRIRNTKQQARIEDKEERKKNVKGAFAINTSPTAIAGPPSPKLGEGKWGKILLVDDVFTTGESMKECGRILKLSGVAEVWAFTLAR